MKTIAVIIIIISEMKGRIFLLREPFRVIVDSANYGRGRVR